MPEARLSTLNGASDTYLASLYWKAKESQRPDALIKDEKAEALVKQMMADEHIRYDFSLVRQIRMNELLNTMRIMFTREFDRYARDFLSRHPEAVAVHIGCGLDSRFERVDNDRVEWYDFLAETVFVYFREAHVKSLVLRLRDHFPGAELVFDGWRPFEVWLGNRYLSKSLFAGLMHWGIWHGQELEGWGRQSTGGGIHLLDAWGFFDQPEPRLNSYRWMAPIFRLFKPMRIFHFRLGELEG